VEFAHRLLQRGDRHVGGVSHPLRIARHLRETMTIADSADGFLTDRRREADVRREKTVVASLARTMQKRIADQSRFRGVVSGT